MNTLIHLFFFICSQAVLNWKNVPNVETGRKILLDPNSNQNISASVLGQFILTLSLLQADPPVPLTHTITFHGISSLPASSLAVRTKSKVSYQNLNISLQVLANTVINGYAIGYIVMQKSTYIYIIQQTINGANCSQGSGYRSDFVEIQVELKEYKAVAFLEYFNILNTQDQHYFLQLTWHQLNNTALLVQITTNGFNLLSEVRFSIIIFNAKQERHIIPSIYFTELTIKKQSSEIINQVPNYYQQSNRLMYGFASFDFKVINKNIFYFLFEPTPNSPTNLFFSVDQQFWGSINFFMLAQWDCNGQYLFGEYPLYQCLSGCKDPFPKLNTTSQICQTCHYSCLQCLNQSISCTSCSPNRNHNWIEQFQGKNIYQCPCFSGYIEVEQSCVLCSSYIPGCVSCDSTTSCASCVANANLTEDGKCNCTNSAFMVDNQCISIPGCVAIFSLGGENHCTACDSSRNFSINDSSGCFCPQGKQLITYGAGKDESYCSDLKLCGNGILYEGKECDDGNIVAGDGCSPSCMVEPYFLCRQVENLSLCKNTTNFTLLFHQAIRSMSSNSGKIRLSISPVLQQIQSINFESYLIADFDFEVSSISQQGPGNLELSFSFDHNLQGNVYNLAFGLNNTPYFQYPTKTLQLTLSAYNGQLTYQSDPSSNQQWSLAYFSLVISVAFVMFLSIFVERWIGLETVMVYQCVFFSFTSLNRIPFQLMPALYNLRFAVGMNKMYAQMPWEFWKMRPQYKILFFFKTFEYNYNRIIFYPLVFFILLPIILKLIANYLEQSKKENNQQNIETLNKAAQFIINRIFLLISLSIVFLAIFSLYVQVWNEGEAELTNKDNVNIIRIFMGLILVLGSWAYVLIWPILKHRFTLPKNLVVISFSKINQYYPIIYLTYHWFFINFAAVFGSYYFFTQALLSLQGAYLFLLVYLRPYEGLRNKLHNIVICFNQLVCIYSTGLCLYWQLLDPSDKQEDAVISYLAVILFVLLTLTMLLSLIRLVVKSQFQNRQGILRQVLRPFCAHCLKKVVNTDEDQHATLKKMGQTMKKQLLANKGILNQCRDKNSESQGSEQIENKRISKEFQQTADCHLVAQSDNVYGDSRKNERYSTKWIPKATGKAKAYLKSSINNPRLT